ncbi:hypothetical protein PIB30_033652 [Stylosanthes scabra]|uniref:Uncharacterized protein n=1 Tax=Stylosanthes scabra TaxID=79078 RepID=A0ABU6TCS8_9FABA|nr:hypothetical protein [Stylosanthes scabra]
MEDLSMFQRPRTVALEDENPRTYGTVLIYPLNRLVECGFVGDTAVNPWVGIFCSRQGFARESESLMREKVRRRVHGWKGRLLSTAGKHVVIKAVGEAIPMEQEKNGLGKLGPNDEA